MTKVPFPKPSTTPNQQVNLLHSRGIAIPDPAAAEHYLSFHNYYHVSGYVFYFEKKGPTRTHILSRPVSFDDIVCLIRFDQELRELFWGAVLTIEAALRSVIAREITLVRGPFCLENPAIYRDPTAHPQLMEKLTQALAEHRNEPFISHFSNKYQEPIPPTWVMIEVLTFGTISRLYSQLTTDLQKAIARSFHVDHFVLVSWLRALTELRNSCAHHARLWNKVFVNYPKIRTADNGFPLMPQRHNRLGSFIPLIRHLLSVVGEKTDWATELQALISGNKLIRPEDMGLGMWEIFR
jgi:abortive infection bacteriophage resistance protein